MELETYKKISNIAEKSSDNAMEFTKELSIELAPILLSGVKVPFLSRFIQILLGQLFDRVIIPALELGQRAGLVIIDKKRGILAVKKLNQAEQNGSLDEFTTIIDSL